MVYKWYILPIGGLYITYHLLWGNQKPPLTIGPTCRQAQMVVATQMKKRVPWQNFDVQTWMCLRWFLRDSTMVPVNHHFYPFFTTVWEKIWWNLFQASKKQIQAKVSFFGGGMHHVHYIPFRITNSKRFWSEMVSHIFVIFTPKLGYLGDGFFKWLAGTTKYPRHPKREVFGNPILHDLLLEI